MQSIPLDSNEYIHYRGRRHPLLGWLLAALATLGVLWLPGLLALAAVLAVGSARYRLVVTNHRLIERHGLLSQRLRSLDLDHLQRIDLISYGLAGLLSVGRLTLVDRDGDSHRLHWVARPERLARQLESLHRPGPRVRPMLWVEQLSRPRHSLHRLIG